MSESEPTYELLAFPPPEAPTVDGLLETATQLLTAVSEASARPGASTSDEVADDTDAILHDAKQLVMAARSLAAGRAPTFRRADGPAQWLGNLAKGLRAALAGGAYDCVAGPLALADALVEETSRLRERQPERSA